VSGASNSKNDKQPRPCRSPGEVGLARQPHILLVARAAKYIAILGLFLAAVATVAGALAARRFGASAYQASAVAATLIWVVGSASLAIIASARTRPGRINAALLAMLLRMGLPLAAIVYFTRSGHPLAQDGVVGLIAVHFLAGLALETLLSVRIVAAAEGSTHNGGAVKAN